MTTENLREIIKCGETTTVQFKQEFPSQKKIANEMVAMANDEKHLLVCNVAEGANKPYKNIDGDIFVKQGADKRRVTENTEILSLFQQSQKYFPDQEGVADSSAEDIDTLALDRFF